MKIKALVLAAAIAATPAFADWPELQAGWHEIQNPLAAPGTSYVPATDTTTLGTVVADNVTVPALATPGAITVTPVLSKIGSITTVAGASLVDGDSFVIKYASGLTIPVEFDLSPGDGTTGGAVPYVFTAGDTADQIRDGLITLLNGAAGTALTASSGGAATVSLVLDTPGVAGDTNTEAVANAGFAVTGFVNPTAATTVTVKLVACLADGKCTEAGPASSTAVSTATLNGSNFLRYSWTAVPGAAYHVVYRTVAPTSPATTGVVYTGTALGFDDVGVAGDGTTAPTVNGTGVVTAGRFAAPIRTDDGTAAVPSIMGTNVLSGLNFNGLNPELIRNGVKMITFASGAVVLGTSELRFNTSTAYLSAPASNTFRLGLYSATATPASYTLEGNPGTGTNISGGLLILRPGAGSGDAVASTLSIQTPEPTTSGTTAQTQTTRLTVDGRAITTAVAGDLGGRTKTLVDGSATDFVTFTILDGGTRAGKVIYTVKSVDGTALQSLYGELAFTATREGSTYTVAVNSTAETASQVLAAAAGTLTGAVTAACAGGVCTLSANFNSSQTTPVLTLYYRILSPQENLVLSAL